MLTKNECKTIENDKTKETTRLLLSNGEKKSFDLTVMGSINTSLQ